MGLDVYVGPLTRYYSGNWETILQQHARQSGQQVQVVRPTAPEPGPFARLLHRLTGRPSSRDPRVVVANWRVVLRQDAPTGAALDWVDSPDGEYFTDKPAWDCYGALVLWAAYDQNPPSERLAAATDKWSSDPVYVAAVADSASHYRHLLANTELWLPSDLHPPFTAPMPFGNPAVIGSSVRLVSELELLNNNTWRASAGDLERWGQEGAEYGAPLEKSAMFGFAVFHHLAHMSVTRALPMKLDY